MNLSLPSLTGLEWSCAREILRHSGYEDEAVQVLDATPPAERLARSQQKPFEWGQERVLRVAARGGRAQVTVAREMRLAPEPSAST